MKETPSHDELLGVVSAMVADTVAVQALAALSSSGIRCVLLRGPALASLLYDAPSERPYRDVDLLVEDKNFSAAEAALENRGFRESALEAAVPLGRPPHAHTWRLSQGGEVDLHETLIGVGVPPAKVWQVLTRETETMPVGDQTAEVLSVPARALVVALHAAHHVDDASKPLDDLERALERLPTRAWDGAFMSAQELAATEALVSGLQLLSRGRTELLRLGLDPDARAAPRMIERRGDRSFHVAQGMTWLGATPGLRAKLVFVRRRLLPSARTMRERSALARRGRIGLALAYVLRWLDAIRHLPRALVLIRRTRR